MSQSDDPFFVFAEDDAEDQLLVRDAWQQSEPANGLTFVSDGEELIEFLTARLQPGAVGGPGDAGPSGLPNLVMLDLNMPRKDGREVLREMRADRVLRLVPVVVFSTSDADRDVTAAYRLGANSYVSKPDSFPGLVGVFQTLKAFWLKAARIPPRTIAQLAHSAPTAEMRV